MLLAISVSENNLESFVDQRFGRAKGFIIYNTLNDEYKYIDNVQNLEAVQGAGIQSAQNVVNENAEVVITGHCGPKAFRTLSAADVKVYTVNDVSVKDAVEKFKKSELELLDSADVEGHWI